MTGAPKKRSVEILRQLEAAERGIYSGVVGYADVGGGGDWAVIIRSCFKYDEHPPPPPSPLQFKSQNGRGRNDSTHGTATFNYIHETLNGIEHPQSNHALTDEWTLGAGGAITALSDPVAEWEEMITKAQSVLRAFGDIESQ